MIFKKMWNELDVFCGGKLAMTTRWVLLISSVTAWSIGFMVGCDTSIARSCTYDEHLHATCTEPTGCTYKRIVEIINPGYVIGCELFRPRELRFSP